MKAADLWSPISSAMTPLVSILIPAYNAERWIAETIHAALAQTWPRTEIIVIDDGSEDRTLSIARKFASKTVSVMTQENQGASAARNKALELCQGDYIQWLDADDLLAPEKIAKQVGVSCRDNCKRTLFSCAWAYFYYRQDRANFSPSSLWCDLSPTEWLLRKMAQNLHMPNSTWLVSRELTQAAGPWDCRLSLDDDGEYFCRLILASNMIRFVPEPKVLYRLSGSGSLSNVNYSPDKLKSQLLSMQAHVNYIRSLEDSERVRTACLNYLQARFFCFYPEQVTLVKQLQEIAASLGGQLETPWLSWKYAWIEKLFGFSAAKHAQLYYNRAKSFSLRAWDRMMYSVGRDGGLAKLG